MVNVPLFAGNPQLQEQLRLQLPVFLQQVSEGRRGETWNQVTGYGCSLFALPARFPTDAEPRVALHPHQSPGHAGLATDPAGPADPTN